MAKLTRDDLLQLSTKQFEYQAPFKAMCQLLAEQFYPARADFTITRNIGATFADHLSDSLPLLMRRDLGNALQAMLRDGDWFKMGIAGDEPDYAGTVWLSERTELLRRLMYDRSANFVRASKESDHDFVTFGQSVKSIEVNRLHNGLLFRCWHLRDCAWFEDESGQVCGVFRKTRITRHNMIRYFGEDKVSTNVTRDVLKQPFVEVHCQHIVLPSDMYGDDQIIERFPYVSIWIDTDNQHIMEVSGSNHKQYVVPRFHTIPGCAYAYSPATEVGLADARCLQAMTHTLLEAAERYARPPIVATERAVRSDVDLGPDGITWVDFKYDEKMGPSLRPLFQNASGWPVGNAERQRIQETLTSAFFLNKLRLPDAQSKTMTAYEVSQLMQQYRRENLPLFAPIEAEDNGQTCELAFEIAMQNNMLGSPYDIPPSLRGSQVRFKFISPLTARENEEIAQRYQQVSQMLAEAVNLDPMIGHDVDLSAALRDAIEGLGQPEWLTPPQVAAQQKAMAQLAQAAQQAALSSPQTAAPGGPGPAAAPAAG